jgi:hypothetical protein
MSAGRSCSRSGSTERHADALRRQGLDPRTVALRVLVRGFLDLRRFVDMAYELGILFPLLSAADPRLPVVRGPSAAQSWAWPANTT